MDRCFSFSSASCQWNFHGIYIWNSNLMLLLYIFKWPFSSFLSFFSSVHSALFMHAWLVLPIYMYDLSLSFIILRRFYMAFFHGHVTIPSFFNFSLIITFWAVIKVMIASVQVLELFKYLTYLYSHNYGFGFSLLI